MDKVRELGVDLNAPASESLPLLTSLPLHTLLSTREQVFTEICSLGLSGEGDVLVARRDTRLKPLSTKLAEDIISLLLCSKNLSAIPRSLLKNGKRRLDYLETSRQSEIAMSMSQAIPIASQTSGHVNAHTTSPLPRQLWLTLHPAANLLITLCS